MKHIFIVNPTSGKGRASKAAIGIKKVCEKENLDYEIHYTKGPGDATKIVKNVKFLRER